MNRAASQSGAALFISAHRPRLVMSRGGLCSRGERCAWGKRTHILRTHILRAPMLPASVANRFRATEPAPGARLMALSCPFQSPRGASTCNNVVTHGAAIQPRIRAGQISAQGCRQRMAMAAPVCSAHLMSGKICHSGIAAPWLHITARLIHTIADGASWSELQKGTVPCGHAVAASQPCW